MIVNTTTLKKQDYFSTIPYRRMDSLPALILLCLAGGVLLYTDVPYIYHMLRGDYTMSLGSMLFVYTFSFVGIVFIAFGLCYSRLVSYISYKRGKDSAKRTYTFTEDGLEVDVSTAKMSQHLVYKYDGMKSFFEKNEALYIEIIYLRRRVFFIIHNSGYTSGSKAEVVALLTQKGVREKFENYKQKKINH